MDEADHAAQAEAHDRALALAAFARQQPRGESAAECVDCGEPIPERRRLAVPGVQTCVDCQGRRELRARVRERTGR